MRYSLIIIFSLLLISECSMGQLSSGGFPLQVNALKSSGKARVIMPVLKQSVIDAALERNSSPENLLKPYTFAHTFEVGFNASNSGQWYSTHAKYHVWKLTIESQNAKSLNLIFNDFHLPGGARLYLYNEETNHYLGAFTSDNNKISGKFAVAPVAGDQITIQYEVPEAMGTPVDFEIARVNHDFIGILKFDRRPLNGRMAGDCNVDVNCESGDKWSRVKNSVCRLIVDGNEICSGTLINNTAENQKPYVLSASHCYDEWDMAETTVFTFNYESPYCAPLDGDPVHSLSGAIMKAHYDSLDFALVVLDELPPPDFRPFYAGWNRLSSLPDSTVSIHHPVGDIKKIAFDNDKPEYATFKSSSIKNPVNGSLKVLRWDDGVTEIGSSGGALFDNHKKVIGTLSGGAAVCGNPVNDYFARFAMQWDYHSDSTKQLKYWLDPLDSGDEVLEGKQFYADENSCDAFTNLSDADEHANVVLTVSGNPEGYWGGSNNVGITEIVEAFDIPGNEILDGVSFGVGKLVKGSGGTGSQVTVKVYEGNALPENLIYSKAVAINAFVEDAMNYIQFDEMVEPNGNFFIGFDLSTVSAQDTFVIYQSLRTGNGTSNQFYYLQNNQWYNFKETNQQSSSMACVMEVVACNVGNIIDSIIPKDPPETVFIYPNPAYGELMLESDIEIDVTGVSVYNMLGQEIQVYIESIDAYRVQLNLTGNSPGVYFVRLAYENSFVTRKFSFITQ